MTTRGLTYKEGIEALARHAGVGPESPGLHRDRAAPSRARAAWPPDRRPAGPSVEQYVTECEAFLWTRGGVSMRRWLARRGFEDEVLPANRIGADPGPRLLPRGEGLPRRGAGVVLPVLDEHGKAIYLQTRYLRADGHRYDNPSNALVGPPRRMAEVRLPFPAAREDVVLVCEGIPDALTVAQAQYRAAAVLGAGYPDERVAAGLVRRYPTGRLFLAFDADERGRAGAPELAAALADRGESPPWVTSRFPPPSAT